VLGDKELVEEYEVRYSTLLYPPSQRVNSLGPRQVRSKSNDTS